MTPTYTGRIRAITDCVEDFCWRRLMSLTAMQALGDSDHGKASADTFTMSDDGGLDSVMLSLLSLFMFPGCLVLVAGPWSGWWSLLLIAVGTVPAVGLWKVWQYLLDDRCASCRCLPETDTAVQVNRPKQFEPGGRR